jgi:Arc/MetJ-type ribon-helix-helix transcriptional regulator
MSTQLTVRLPDHLVTFLDSLVAGGSVKSRAEAIAQALEREERRLIGLADVEILRHRGTDPDLDALAEYMSAHPIELDD